MTSDESQLLERAAELEALTTALERSSTGGGRFVVVAGEAGAGKSSLVETFGSSCEVPTITGWCDPIDPPRVLGPFLDICTELGLPPHSESYAYFGQLNDHLRTSPVVLIVEDVHWADAGSIDFLRFIGRRIGSTKSMVVATVRDDEIHAEHPLWAVLGELGGRPQFTRIDVPPLTIEAIRQLSDGSGRDPDDVFARSGGNAFFASEIVSTEHEVPPSVSAMVLGRLVGLGDGARRIVEAVALAPRGLRIKEALSLADGGDDDADAAVQSGVVTVEQGLLRFRHDLARTAIEAAIPPARLSAGHRRMLHLLVEAGDADPGHLAHHALHSGDLESIKSYVAPAARHAMTLGAAREGIVLYQRALAHREAFTGGEVTEMQLDLASGLRLVNRPAEAVVQAEEALRLCRTRGDEGMLARVLTICSVLRWDRNDLDGSRADIDEAVRLLERADPNRELAEAYSRSAYLWMLGRKRQPAQTALAGYERTRDALGVDPSFQSRMVAHGIEIATGDPDLAIAGLREVLDDARRSGEPIVELSVLGFLGSGGGEVRRYDVAIEALEEGLRLASTKDADQWADYHEAWLARIAFEQGRWDDATTIGQRRPEKVTPYAAVTALGTLGRVRTRRGDPGARDTLTEAIAAGDGCEVQHVWSAYCGLAELAWLDGRHDDIVASLADLPDRVAETDSWWGRGEVAFWQWRGGASHIADGLAEPFALQIAGDWRSAARAWSAIGCPYEEAMALLDGDTDALNGAIAILDRLGARPLAMMARAKLRDLGVRPTSQPRSGTAANPAGLTNRQLDVVRLLVDGFSNAEIAQRLYISKKTAEHHVSSAFAKLGVNTRAKAITEARRLGVTGPDCEP